MRVSIFTTITDPARRGDNHIAALSCYASLANEVIIVQGGTEMPHWSWFGEADRMKRLYLVSSPWPREFSWDFIGQQFQKGYELASGDWVIHCDLDFIFHDQDYRAIRQVLADNDDAPAVSFYKWQFIQPDRYNLKSRITLAVNKGRYGDRIKFNGGGDLCQPTLDGEYLSPDFVQESRIPMYNYDKICKTEAQVRDDVGRMARAWEKHWGEKILGGPDDSSAYREWCNMMQGRNAKPQKHIPLVMHPKVMQPIIQALRPDQFGYNGFGMFDDNDYVQ
jgi:hypothetical protein